MNILTTNYGISPQLVKKAEEIRLILLTKCALSMPYAARTPYPAYKSLQIQ